MTKPFVYINVSGGIAEETAYGEIDTLQIDWDGYRDEGDYTRSDIAEKLWELHQKWPRNVGAKYRKLIIADLIEVGDKIPRDDDE